VVTAAVVAVVVLVFTTLGRENGYRGLVGD
jgi:hypothetical protein